MIRWKGHALEELGYRLDTGDLVVRVDPRYFRPAEVDTLLVIPPARKNGLTPTTTLEELIAEMVTEDMHEARKRLC